MCALPAGKQKTRKNKSNDVQGLLCVPFICGVIVHFMRNLRGHFKGVMNKNCDCAGSIIT